MLRNQTGSGTPITSIQKEPALFLQSSSGLNVQLTTYLNLMLKLGISEAIPPVLLTPAWGAQHSYFDFTSFSRLWDTTSEWLLKNKCLRNTFGLLMTQLRKLCYGDTALSAVAKAAMFASL